MSDEIQKINVMISGRSFPLRVPESEVQLIKDIVAEINQKVLQFQNTYKSKDARECLSMVLLTYAVDLYRIKSGHVSDQEVSTSELSRLDQLLDQYIQTS